MWAGMRCVSQPISLGHAQLHLSKKSALSATCPKAESLFTHVLSLITIRHRYGRENMVWEIKKVEKVVGTENTGTENRLKHAMQAHAWQRTVWNNDTHWVGRVGRREGAGGRRSGSERRHQTVQILLLVLAKVAGGQTGNCLNANRKNHMCINNTKGITKKVKSTPRQNGGCACVQSAVVVF